MVHFPSFGPLILPAMVLAVYIGAATGYKTFTSGQTERYVEMEQAWENMVANPLNLDQMNRKVQFLQQAEQQAASWRSEPVTAYKLLSQLQNILKPSEMSPDAFRLDFTNEWPELERPSPVDEGALPVLQELPTALLQVKIGMPTPQNSQRIKRRLLEDPILSRHLESIDVRAIYPMETGEEEPSEDYIVLYALTFQPGRFEP